MAALAGAASSAWWHRPTRPFVLLLGFAALWPLGSALAHHLPSVEAKGILNQLLYLPILGIPPALLATGLRAAGLAPYTRGRWAVALVLPFAGVLLIVWTNPWHGWYWANLREDRILGIPLLAVERGPLYPLSIAASYPAILAGWWLLLRSELRSGDGRGALGLSGVIAPPLAANVAYHLELTPPGLDATPLAFSISGVILFWALLRRGVPGLLPLAHREIVRNLGDGILLFDRRGKLAEVNEAAVRNLGIVGDAVACPSAARDLFSRLPALRAVVEAPPPQTAEIPLPGGDGSETVRVRTTELRGARGQPLGRLAVLEDLSEELRAAQMARESTLRGIRMQVAELANRSAGPEEALEQACPLLRGALGLDASVAFVRTEEEWRNVARFDPLNLLAPAVPDGPPAPTGSTVSLAVQRALRDGEVAVEVAAEGPDGTPRARQAAAVPVGPPEAPTGLLVLGSRAECPVDSRVRDLLAHVGTQLSQVEERRQVREALRRAVERERAASEAKSQFVSAVSHELRTPLHGLAATAALLLEDEPDPARVGALETILAAARALQGIVEDILALQQIGGEADPDTSFDLRRILGDLVALHRSPCEQRGLRLALDVDEALPRRLRGPLQPLREIALRFLSNAVKFTKEGGIEVRVRAEPVRRGRVDVRIEVRDTGVGIPPEEIGCIFEPFTQADMSDTRRFQGLGLGLPIARRLAESIGARIEVESTPGRGSTFSVALDLQVVSEREAGAEEPPPSPRAPETGLRVLVVDDNELNRKVAAAILTRLGCRVSTASGGREAVERALRGDIDLVFMDCQMPEMDGYAATRAIRAREEDRRVPIVALTANAAEGSRENCLAAGMDDFVTKPAGRERFEEILARWGRRRAS